MLNNSRLKHLLAACMVLIFVSCDKDFNEIGSDVIGDDHYGLVKDDTKSIIAYNQSLGAMQSNNLPINALGYYNNPLFGKTIVMTGFRDTDIQEALKNIGARLGSSVSKNTFVVLVKDLSEDTGKAADARRLGVLLTTPEVFKEKYF